MGTLLLKRELLNIISHSDNNLVSNAIKMINPEVLELSEENFKIDAIKLTSEMASFLNLIDQEEFKSNGVKIKLSSISSPDLVKTVDELKLEIETFRKKQKRLISAIEAKKDYESKKKQLKALSLELKELEQKLEWIRTFGEDEKKFNLLNKAIVESEKTLIESKSKEEEKN